MTQLTLIAAMAKNRVIGINNSLPWRLPEDLQHFKQTTMGKPIIMGRKTWESLGRLLPGRKHIVISRDANYHADGIYPVQTVAQALACVSDQAEAFVIGGAEIYALTLPLAQRLILTEIDTEVQGDAWFPPFSASDWQETSRESHQSANGLAFDFVSYTHR